MTVAPGTRIGPFEIRGLLGAGGMGEVWRAHDATLHRDVALKVLPDAVGHDPDRLGRFKREAQLLASLNHPNIAAIYGFEESAGVRALVLELVEGPTLADRIAEGPMPAASALPIAKQIAEALEAAHEHGIVHRDLKPANIKVRRDGTVKVLDFGLAKALDAAAPERATSEAATLSSPAMTRAGVILGTAAYMSPEQARGLPVDRRADIWAFGCVLFEMLTGTRAFEGATVPDVLAAVLTAQPGWSRLPSHLHPRIRLLLERCLEKDPRDRGHDIADARVDLQKVVADAAGRSSEPPLKASASKPGPRLVWAAAGVALAAIAAWVGVPYLVPDDARPVTRLSYPLPEGQSFTNTVRSMLAMAPDGSSIVYVANDQLHRRAMDAIESTPIRGTTGNPSTPFFSPDGQSLGYWDAGDAQIKRIPVSGGTAVTLAHAVTFYGGNWGSDGNILYGQEEGVWRVPATAGSPQRIVEIGPGERVHGPELLPDGETLLFTLLTTAQRTGSAAWDDAQIVVQSLENGTRKAIITGADGRFVPTGHLVYALNTVLFAVPFRASSHGVQGGPVVVVEGVLRAARTPGSSASANYAFSEHGTLVYVPTAPDARGVLRTLVAVDRAGRFVPLLDEQRAYWRPRVSPDGKQLAVEVTELKGDDLLHEQIWIVDLESRSATPLAVENDLNVFAVWTPDGQSIVFRSNRDSAHAIYRQRVDGSEGATLLLKRPNEAIPTSATPDGVVAFSDGSQTGLRAIWTMRLADGSASELLATPAMEHMAMFSPDGKWVAYVSNESGRFEVYVRPSASSEGVGRRVSLEGGTAPVWARDGSELFYRSASGDLMAVPASLAPTLTLGRPHPLFKVTGRFRTSGNAAAYDVLADGRFVMVTEPETPVATPRQINVVGNWFEELRRVQP